jgi:16S rRNA processing protein RimM
VRGELAVEILTDFPERFDGGRTVYLGEDARTAEARQVKSLRWHKDRVLLSLEGCEDRTTAEQLRGKLVQIPIQEAMPLPEDEYYPHQLVGLDVYTLEGENLGKIGDVLFTKANEIFVVNGPRGEIWLPAIADVIQQVDLEQGRVVVRPMEGLLE